MNARGIVSRTLRTVLRAVEGEFRPGPYYLPISGGWLPDGSAENWWQLGQDIQPFLSRSAIVEACISAYAQTVAMLPGDHWRANNKGGRTRVTNSALARVLRYPNEYQSISDFMLNLTRSLYALGNAYALALRNDRYEIDELHLMDGRICRPMVAENGDVFYQLMGNDVIARRLGGGGNMQLTVPQRDVLHVRLNTVNRYPRPLVGTSPIEAVADDLGVSSAIAKQQTNFYMNEARPSAVISTDLVLDKDQVQFVRDRWNEQAQKLKQGGTPILTAGLKVQPWTIGGRDASLAEVMKMSKENVALAFRVPLQILGIGGTPYASTELLMQSWIAMGLGFCLNHIEEAFGLLFVLDGQPDEYLEFNTRALLRSAEKDRIEALTKGVQGGIYSPNEARNQENLDSVKDGDEPRVQQQVVPLSAASMISTTTSSTGPHPPPAPPQPPAAGQPAKPDDQPKAKGYTDDAQREFRRILAGADRIGRSRSRT